MIAFVFADTLIKLITVDDLKELRKNILTHLLSYVAKNHILAGIEKFLKSPKVLLQLPFNITCFKLTGQ
jgi:hypothetical protein